MSEKRDEIKQNPPKQLKKKKPKKNSSSNIRKIQ